MTPRLAAIVAVDDRLGIGRDGDIPPWTLTDDLARFRARTIGRPTLMGRHTHVSIGRALPKRRNLVVSRTGDVTTPGVEVFASIEQALDAASNVPEIMVIGGASIYAALAPQLDELHLTHVHGDFDADTLLHGIPVGCWTLVDKRSYPADERNAYPCDVYVLQRDPALEATGELTPDDLARLANARLGDTV